MNKEAKAYIEWGGQYDVRDLELIAWQGTFVWEDMTGGHMTIHDFLTPRATESEATEDLKRVVFGLGEPSTYIDFGDIIVRKADFDRPKPIVG